MSEHMDEKPKGFWERGIPHGIAACLILVAIAIAVFIIVWSPGGQTTGTTSPPSSPPPQGQPPAGILESEPDPEPEPEPAATDSELEAGACITLESLGIDVSSVQIADGRDKGGERVLIVGFTTQHPRQSKMFGELVEVLESGYALNKSLDGDIDSIIAIAGDSAGNLVSTVTTSAVDAGRAARKEITPAEYLETWTWGPGWKR